MWRKQKRIPRASAGIVSGSTICNMYIYFCGRRKATLDLQIWVAALHRKEKHVDVNEDTLPKTNIAPEKWPSQKETSIPTTNFQGLC